MYLRLLPLLSYFAAQFKQTLRVIYEHRVCASVHIHILTPCTCACIFHTYDVRTLSFVRDIFGINTIEIAPHKSIYSKHSEQVQGIEEDK